MITCLLQWSMFFISNLHFNPFIFSTPSLTPLLFFYPLMFLLLYFSFSLQFFFPLLSCLPTSFHLSARSCGSQGLIYPANMQVEPSHTHTYTFLPSLRTKCIPLSVSEWEAGLRSTCKPAHLHQILFSSSFSATCLYYNLKTEFYCQHMALWQYRIKGPTKKQKKIKEDFLLVRQPGNLALVVNKEKDCHWLEASLQHVAVQLT